MNIIKQIYIYVVSTFALVVTLVGGTMFLVNALSLTYFSGYQESFQQYVQNAQADCNSLMAYQSLPSDTMMPPYSRFTKAQCEQLAAGDIDSARLMYDIVVADNKDMERRNEIGQMIKSIPWFLVAFPIFLWFNRMRKMDQ